MFQVILFISEHHVHYSAEYNICLMIQTAPCRVAKNTKKLYFLLISASLFVVHVLHYLHKWLTYLSVLRTSLSTHTIPPQCSQTLALHMDPNVHGLRVLLCRLQYRLPSWWLSHLMLVRLDFCLHHGAGSFLKAAGGWGSFLDYNQEATPSDAFSSRCQCSGELLTLFFFSSFADHKDSAASLAHQAILSNSCQGW